ncbi:MAG: phosphatidylserine decarboxylase family protein [Gemmatimonadaceae bacterium]|nr:phosphatidylserine decarboxylase family protein [Gemmatimonadaceae bacterium]
MRFAKEGVPFIAIAVAIAAACVWFAAAGPSPLRTGLAAFTLLLALWVAYFFRDPEREGPRGDRIIISPADGRIVHVTEVHEPAFVNGPALRISVFMNVFNVHVNRYPVSGVVRYVHYNPGKFLNAAVEKASLENEQSSVGIESPAGPVLVRQIAGLVARRIVTYSRVGAAAAQGERFGMIRFGSRLDVFVPPDSKVMVRVGDRVAAGTTVLAER